MYINIFTNIQISIDLCILIFISIHHTDQEPRPYSWCTYISPVQYQARVRFPESQTCQLSQHQLTDWRSTNTDCRSTFWSVTTGLSKSGAVPECRGRIRTGSSGARRNVEVWTNRECGSSHHEAAGVHFWTRWLINWSSLILDLVRFATQGIRQHKLQRLRVGGWGLRAEGWGCRVQGAGCRV